MAIFLVATLRTGSWPWLRAGEPWPWLGTAASAGGSTPTPSATMTARSWSTWLRLRTTPSRMWTWSTFPSSKRKAATMCSFSQSAMLFQNRVAWL
ncbi:hypothetical protein SAMN05216275_13835 [Streptosporangium canum]|uniref:Uncharacterized protein n=1 Tax=Streptosporangium canum TaxID=324952 RepID=A0A1I4CZS3_9ACTN|nr:hypothetical protein SAMN05216275_13835 [Streptosporangium canum]